MRQKMIWWIVLIVMTVGPFRFVSATDPPCPDNARYFSIVNIECTENCSGISVEAVDEPTGAVHYQSSDVDQCSEIPLLTIQMFLNESFSGEKNLHVNLKTFGNASQEPVQLFVNGTPHDSDSIRQSEFDDVLLQDYAVEFKDSVITLHLEPAVTKEISFSTTCGGACSGFRVARGNHPYYNTMVADYSHGTVGCKTITVHTGQHCYQNLNLFFSTTDAYGATATWETEGYWQHIPFASIDSNPTQPVTINDTTLLLTVVEVDQSGQVIRPTDGIVLSGKRWLSWIIPGIILVFVTLIYIRWVKAKHLH